MFRHLKLPLGTKVSLRLLIVLEELKKRGVIYPLLISMITKMKVYFLK